MPEPKQFIPTPEIAPTKPETVSVPDQSVERRETVRNESEPKRNMDGSVAVIQKAAATLASSAPRVALPKDPVYAEVEHVLEDGLMPYYQAMNPKNQKLFREHGETLTKTLAQMVQTTKVHLEKVVELIRRWLLLIPGINRLFLEQEAKIRADRIATIARFEQERRNPKR